MFTLTEQIVRTGNECLSLLKSIEDFNLFAHVFTDSDGQEMDCVISVDRDNMHAAVVNDEVIPFSEVQKHVDDTERVLRDTYEGQELVDRIKEARDSMAASLCGLGPRCQSAR